MSSNQTVGQFLVEKAHNMRTWLATEGLEIEPLGAELPVVAVAAAQELRSKAQAAIDERDFEALVAHDSMPETIHQVVAFVQCREDLHDKFWRYLALFSECVQ